MNIKKVDNKPMVIHTKEKPKVHVKGAPETKIKGRNILTVQHGPKIAGSVVEKSVAADGKIKLKRSSVHVTDKRKIVQAKTGADGMEYRGRNGGGSVQDRKGNGTTQGRNGATVKGRSGATVKGRSGATEQGRNSGGTTHGRNEGGTAQGRYADRNTQGRQGKEQEVRQSVNKENRMYAQYRIAKAEKEAAIKKKSALPSGIASVAARTALDEMEGGNEVHDAYMTAYTLAKPVTNAVDVGRNLYRSQAAKQKYGTPDRVENVSDVRDMVRRNFWMQKNVEQKEGLPERVRNAARDGLEDTFGTSEPDVFNKMLENGLYDGMYHAKEEKRQISGQSR